MSDLAAAILAVSKAIIANKEYLTDLDSAIGDGDHGLNMARGFEAVVAKLNNGAPLSDVGAAMKLIGMTLISTVGGAAGPLYGTAFLRAAAPSTGKTAIDEETAEIMLQAAIKGIKDRGKANRGEKTMIDALEPALAAFQEAREAGKPLTDCLHLACDAAKQGIEFTKTIIATKGRASYLGERSLGHQDPGATSSFIMLDALTRFYDAQAGVA